MMRTAQRARFSAGPARCSWPLAPALCRRSEGWVLFWIVFPPPFFISSVLFLSLALWVGIAATCWLSDSWADCPLTVPSPEQKSRRGSPSVCPYLLLPCLWKALVLLKTLSASSGEAGAGAVSKDCPALQLAAREWNTPLAKACHSLLLPLLLSCLWG